MLFRSDEIQKVLGINFPEPTSLQESKDYIEESLKETSNPLNLKYIDTWHKGQNLAFNNKTDEAIKAMSQAAKEAYEYSKKTDGDFAEYKYYLGTIAWFKKDYKTIEKIINDKQVKNSGNDVVLKKLLQNKDKSYKEAYGSDLKENQPNPKNQPQWVWLEYKNRSEEHTSELQSH